MVIPSAGWMMCLSFAPAVPLTRAGAAVNLTVLLVERIDAYSVFGEGEAVLSGEEAWTFQ